MERERARVKTPAACARWDDDGFLRIVHYGENVARALSLELLGLPLGRRDAHPPTFQEKRGQPALPSALWSPPAHVSVISHAVGHFPASAQHPTPHTLRSQKNVYSTNRFFD
ncbi:hypothetical protein MHYP_G00180690 [Metynnis hypsauchen]